ncbi:type II toxin-antitoxin system HipA family toxin [Rugamonas sp. A1-17]|nr:type II toxin-antitoxin system HipA family toxin [Rugamonas sp. A1-17]
MYQPVAVIEVRIWDQQVGAVTLDPTSGYYIFEYASSWRRRGVELAPLTMPVANGPYVFPLLPAETYQRLPALLADCLPDRFGNALVDAYLAREGVAAAQITALDRLAYMATRGMGALEFRPTRGPRKFKATAVEIATLVEGARSALAGQFDGDAQTQAAIANLIQVGTSAGGARAKAVIAWNRTTNEIRSGQLPADEGFEYYLLKFDGVGKDFALGTGANYGRIEYAYHLMARTAGIDMTDCSLLEESGRAHFMTKRYDRVAGKKVHAQTLCAMAHLDFNQIGTHDYSQYFLTINQLKLGSDALAEGFRRMVFNCLAGNNDDHTKNLSFLLPEGGQWQLAPAYDVTHAYNPESKWTRAHLMGVNGKFESITLADMQAVGDRFLVPGYNDIIRDVSDAVARWPEFATAANVPHADTLEIGELIGTLAVF